MYRLLMFRRFDSAFMVACGRLFVSSEGVHWRFRRMLRLTAGHQMDDIEDSR